MLGAFVPSLFAQPLLERMEMNFWVRLAKAGDISLITSLVEPSKHHVKLFSQDQANEWQGKLLKFHGLPKDAAKDLRRLKVGQLTSGDLKFLPYEFGWTFERQSCKGSDVIGSNRLVGLVTSDGVRQLAFQDSDFDLIN